MKVINLKNGGHVIVDDEDFEFLSQWQWSQHNSGTKIYARREEYINGKRKRIYMHREILKGFPLIDHKNGDGLDNRKENLRSATKSQNASNSYKSFGKTKIRGVHWNKQNQNWRVRIRVNKKIIEVGSFKELEDALNASVSAYRKYLGEFSPC